MTGRHHWRGAEPAAKAAGAFLLPDARFGRPESGGDRFRWAWCPADGQLHLVALADVDAAAAVGGVSASCGQRITVADVTLLFGLVIAWPRPCFSVLENVIGDSGCVGSSASCSPVPPGCVAGSTP